MAIYKRCTHKGKDRDRCDDEWYASYLLRGHSRARVSLAKWAGRAVRTKTDALKAFDDLKQEIRAGRFTPLGLNVSRPATPDDPLTFRWLVSMFETHYVKGKRLKTADDFPYRIKPLLDAFGDTPLVAITTTRVETWYAQRREQAEHDDRSQAWQNRPVSQLRTVLNWAAKRGYIPADAVPDFEIDAEDYSRWRRLNADEERRLLDSADPVLRSLLILGLDTGMRRGEMLALRVGDVDLDAGVIRLRGTTTKSAKTRDLPILSERLRTALTWLRTNAKGDPRPMLAALVLDASGAPLLDFRYHWNRARLLAYGFTPHYGSDSKGLTPACRQQIREIDLHWHDLRHEFACRLDDRGVALGKIQRLLGHASIATTERYLRRGLKELQTIVLDDGTLPNVVLPERQTRVAKVGQPPNVLLSFVKPVSPAVDTADVSHSVSVASRAGSNG